MRNYKTIVHFISTLERGGAQEVLKTVCSETAKGHRHIVFYISGTNAYEAAYDPLASAIPLNVDGLFSLVRALGYLLRFFKTTTSSVAVQGWLYQGNLLALLVKFFSPRIPIVFSIHNGSDRGEFVSMSSFLASRVCGLFSGMAKLTIFVSRKSLTCHVRYKNSVVIPNPIKPLNVADCMLEARPDFWTSQTTLACVARFDPVKNIELILDVMRHLALRGVSVRLLLAGEGMSTKNSVLIAMIGARGLEDRVELLGVVSDIAPVFLVADYTILASKYESFSNVLMESIACGTPFVSSDVGIATELVSPESFVIQGYNAANWVDKLEKILQVRKTPLISRAVRQHYEQISASFQPECVSKLYVGCWEKAMEH